jgi:DNA-binding NtrC family response regulator
MFELRSFLEHPSAISSSLVELLDASRDPIYAVDAQRQLVYCNGALAAWLGSDVGKIIGRRVEYHSEAAGDWSARGDSAPPLTDLCPPPQALAGDRTRGTVSCFGRDGRLVHRQAEFLPLPLAGASSGGVLVLLAAADMSPHELATELSTEPSADELHRAIRSFRRGQATEFALESLLGESPGMRKVRAQVVAAAASQANVLIHGLRGTGREHVARAIHYQAKEAAGKLVPIDCAVATEESLRRALESVRGPRNQKQQHTLVLLNAEQLPAALQSQLLPIVAGGAIAARTVATVTSDAIALESQFVIALSTIRIEVPSIAERLEDLPLLCQFFLEAANRGNQKQVGSLRPEALDQLALYRWPGGLDELRSAIFAAHAAAASHEITPADLPTVVHHAAQAAAFPRRAPEKINLDELLESIEREVITRAMAQVGGNKSAAAELLGMTRPRLYRRLVQLGLVLETSPALEDGLT